ncbi:MAG: AsnC family transcriptional regulator, partial [Nanoarchaeota archaeon]|nr:AsnC family transcriptional regulator [Nanoarchaeota archaeon]
MKNNKSIITDKDVLILQKLLEDGRKSSASISKEIDLGREIVNYRIKRLIKENLIVKFVPRINEKAMHFQEYIILLKLNLDDEVSKQKFAYDTIGNKYLIWTIKSDSGWDLIVRLYAASNDEFKEKLAEILDGFSSVLTNYYTIISSDEIKENEKEVISRELFQKDISKKDFSVIKEDVFGQVDDKDKEILNLLETDARIQYKEIGEKLEISADTVK